MWEARAPGGRRHPWAPGFRQPWILDLLVESWPCVRGALTSVCPGKGLWMALCLSWPLSLLSLAPRLPTQAGFGQSPRRAGLQTGLPGSPWWPRTPGLFRTEARATRTLSSPQTLAAPLFFIS